MLPLLPSTAPILSCFQLLKVIADEHGREVKQFRVSPKVFTKILETGVVGMFQNESELFGIKVIKDFTLDGIEAMLE